MQITIDLPDALQISETDLRTELAISLFQQERMTLIPTDAPPAIAPHSTLSSPSSDPLFQLAGCTTSDLTDVAKNHDYYLGQALYKEMHRGE
jgi:hypothetical protein